jgi:hypothetical protein
VIPGTLCDKRRGIFILSIRTSDRTLVNQDQEENQKVMMYAVLRRLITGIQTTCG